MLKYEVMRAGHYLESGWPLVAQLPRELRIPVALFVRGGCAILSAIVGQNYDVWSRRPIVRAKLSLFVSVLIPYLLGGLSADDF